MLATLCRVNTESSLSPPSRSRLFATTVFALLLLAVILRIVQLGAGASLWFDELALALNIEERGFSELATQPLDRLQVAPVGFLFALEAMTRLLGVDELALRLIPFLSGLASVLLFALVARRFVAGPGLLFGLVLFAVSPSLVYTAGAAKPYAVDVAVTLLLVWFGLRHFERPGDTRRAAYAGAAGALAILLSNPAVPTAMLIVALLFASRLRERERPHAVPFAALAVPWILAGLVAAISAMRLLDPATETYMKAFWSEGFPPESVAGYVPWLLHQLYGVVAHFLIFVVPSGGALAAIVIVPMLFAVVGARTLGRRCVWRTALVLAPLVVAVVCATADLLPLRTRVSLYAGWPILLTAMVGIETALRSKSRAMRGAVLSVVFLVGGLPTAAVLLDSPPPYRTEEMRPVLEEVAEKRQPGDELWVYYGARHAIDFYGPRMGFEAWDQGGMHRDDSRAYLRELDRFRGLERVWVVFTHALPRYAEIELLRAYLETIGRFVDEVPDPYELEGERAAGAWLVDLSDTARLEGATADTFERDGAEEGS